MNVLLPPKLILFLFASGLENDAGQKLIRFMKEFVIRRKAFQNTGNAVHSSALQDIEQEKEVAFKVETICVVQKQEHYSPIIFRSLHSDIAVFVNTGRPTANSTG